MLFRFVFVLMYAHLPHPRAPISRLSARGPPEEQGGERGAAWKRDHRLSAEEGSEPVPQDRLRDEQRDDGAPLRPIDEKGQAAGEVSDTSQPLWLISRVGHDPEDPKEPCSWACRSLGRGRTQGPVWGFNDTFITERVPDDALRQRGPPGPLARTHRG